MAAKILVALFLMALLGMGMMYHGSGAQPSALDYTPPPITTVAPPATLPSIPPVTVVTVAAEPEPAPAAPAAPAPVCTDTHAVKVVQGAKPATTTTDTTSCKTGQAAGQSSGAHSSTGRKIMDTLIIARMLRRHH